jgi:hypothetical protein
MKLAQTNMSRRDSLKIARRFNAGIGLDGALSPGGTAENARPFRPSLRDKIPARQTNWGNWVAAASWSAPALWRFGRRETSGQKSGRGLAHSKTLRSF